MHEKFPENKNIKAQPDFCLNTNYVPKDPQFSMLGRPDSDITSLNHLYPKKT
jgi:hypothetical protein